ncbi:MAG: DUF853 domain-containing protein [Succinivibrio sp.]|nr:DUF853 domain-containing protein [Succinivibrio sp.]
MANRHGLITGATGTGKTVTLQTLAESFSSLGVPVFMADVKGDLSGIAAPAQPSGKIAERISELKLAESGYTPKGCPVCFFDVFGRQGHPLRVTISELGPLLLSRVLNLNEVQTGLLHMAFRIADDQGLLLLDLKDLRSLLVHLNEEKAEYQKTYGNISAASLGAIQRGLLRLEEEGGDLFFGEPALNIEDLLQTDAEGHGIVNILCAKELIGRPKLYSTFLLYLLSELYENLPETGDPKQPRLVFFFDEAHLLFTGIEDALLEKIEQVVRLIRSKGVGVYFISQNPADLPDTILGQLGNRIQHALRAFTPREQKAVLAAAASFRPNPDFVTEQVIGELGVGEALVSLLDAKGVPSVVQRCYILPPQSYVGALDEAQKQQCMRNSLLRGVYDESVDRESAYELLQKRAAQKEQEAQLAQQEQALEQQRAQLAKQQEKEQERERLAKEREVRRLKSSVVNAIATQAARSIKNPIGRAIGSSLMRGLLGNLFGTRK